MNAPLPFQEFQFAFARHIRAPGRVPRPPAIPARSMQIYNELLYNNLAGFLDACFPISQRILGERRWGMLCRRFFSEWRSHTPYFREIPREFLRWLMESQPTVSMPAFMVDMLHYEWVELAVDIMEAPTPEGIDADGDLLTARPVLNPALMNLSYEWPVHRISPDYRPRKPRAVQLLVFRDHDEKVRFIKLNPVSARLVALLQPGSMTGRQALQHVAGELGHADTKAIMASGAALLDSLRSEGAVLGVMR